MARVQVDIITPRSISYLMTDNMNLDPDLLLGQLVMIGVIHAGLTLALLWINRAYGDRPFFLRGEWWRPYSMMLGIAVLSGVVVAGVSLAAVSVSIMTVMVVNAGFLTLWFLELALISGQRFFTKLLGNDLPRELCIFVGFVLATNGGYFTLMFIAALFRSQTL